MNSPVVDEGKASPKSEHGSLCLVLHAHLPFVRHPDHERWLEEDWLYEAIIEVYLPLLQAMDNLLAQGAHFRLTLTMSPTLATMLTDDLLQKRFVRHVDRLIELSEKEVERTRLLPELHPLALRYAELFRESKKAFVETYDWNLVAAFRRIQDAGALDIVTCGATHGFLPLMLENRSLWRGQIATAVDDHRRHFGRAPRGIWLPECGYCEGIDEILAEEGLEYFFGDTHAVLHSEPRPRNGVYAPIRTSAGVFVFARDQESSRQVWSSEVGYPGDPVYREFYRDIGFDLDYEYVKPYLHSDGNRTNLGIKYYRVTARGDDKDPYDFGTAKERAAQHAGHFLNQRMAQAKRLHEKLGQKPVIVAPYDAELFGHWWFEGPQFLEYLLLKIHYDQDVIDTVTAGEWVDRNSGPEQTQEARPSMSSWGHNGFCEYWLDESNDWLYPHLEMAGTRMVELADRFGKTDELTPLQKRALEQAGRELLLAQSSDWAFILKTGTVVEYATWRAKGHLANFNKLYHDLKSGQFDEGWLTKIESLNNPFPELDHRSWATTAARNSDSRAQL